MEQETPPPAVKRESARRKKFIAMAIKYANLAKAARKAGYAAGSAKYRARDLWADPEIRAEIEQGRKEIAETAKMEAIEILEGLAAIARATPKHFKSVKGQLRLVDPEDERLWEAVVRVRTRKDPVSGEVIAEPVLRDGIKARALYMKHLGMLRDIVQLTTPIPIQIYIPDNRRDAKLG